VKETTMTTGMTRREAWRRVSALVGGLALMDAESLLAGAFDESVLAQAMAAGIGDFTAADIALLDDIAETILPETSTPGAKAAKTGAFMALMVTDSYTARNRQVFRDGMRELDLACRAAHNGVSFMQATPAQRLTLLEALDREQKTAMDERAAWRSRAPAPEAPAADDPPHYFRMMKELTLLGYFTSEIGYKQAMRYIETPGRFDPCATVAPGDRSWAP
jgi:Gluconate 2-dehydrogenase subunit 3